MIPDRSEWALQLRIGLVQVLCACTSPSGVGTCAECIGWFWIEDLEIDHPRGRTWYGRSLNCLDRIRRQWREFDRGVKLRALCRGCNAADGANRKPRYRR